MSGKRIDRLSQQFRNEIALLLQNGEVKDPRLGFVSVTGVRLSKDGKHAKVFVSVYGSDAEQKASIDALRSAQGYIRRLLLKRLHVRQAPNLDFQLDHSIKAGIRIDELLRQLPENQPQPDDEELESKTTEE